MKIIAKGSKSLLSQTSSKPKKVDKYKETSEPTKFKYTFEVGETIIYKGIIDEYRNTVAVITKRSHKNQNEYYCIKFSLDDSELKDINGNILKNLEDHEAELANEENNETQEDGINDLSELEKQIIDKGLIPMKNFKSCQNPILFYQKSCEQCLKEPICIYWKKYLYDKVKL